MTNPKRRTLGPITERLRSTNIDDREAPKHEGGSFLTFRFTENQFGWLEDFNDCWVELITLPFGENSDPATSDKEVVLINDLPEFIKIHQGQNIWRSWQIWKDSEQKKCIGEVPFWLDIDDTNENLENAHTITHSCIELIINDDVCSKDPNRIRIGFSGRKGFHIYINPITTFDGREFKNNLAFKVRKKLGLEQPDVFSPTNTFFESTVIDVIHPHIRIMGSLHSWTKDDGKVMARRTFEMSYNEFLDLNIEEILKQSSYIIQNY